MYTHVHCLLAPALSSGSANLATSCILLISYTPAPPESTNLVALMGCACRQVTEFEQATQEQLSDVAAKEMMMTFYQT